MLRRKLTNLHITLIRLTELITFRKTKVLRDRGAMARPSPRLGAGRRQHSHRPGEGGAQPRITTLSRY